MIGGRCLANEVQDLRLRAQNDSCMSLVSNAVADRTDHKDRTPGVQSADPGVQSACLMSPGDLCATLEPVTSLDELEVLWLNLERRSDCSFFQSWAWIGCWLRLLPSDLAPLLLRVSAGSQVVGLGVLMAREETRHGILRVRRLYLNATGDPSIDTLGLEYNGILADRRVGELVIGCFCLTWLLQHKELWDELNLGGLDTAATGAWAKAARKADLGFRIWSKVRCDYVDLSKVRNSGTGYLDCLSRNSRYQIRRAIRLYETTGPLSLTAAQTPAEGFAFLEELRDLHQTSWIRRGHPGAFASEYYGRFHHDLVSGWSGSGDIQLLRVSAGNQVIGYLYNLVKDGVVYAYQSGFNYDSDPRRKPGLVSHAFAIEYNLKSGARIYDFMAGKAQHKKSLGTDVDEMTWPVVYRKLTKLRIENLLRDLKSRIRTR